MTINIPNLDPAAADRDTPPTVVPKAAQNAAAPPKTMGQKINQPISNKRYAPGASWVLPVVGLRNQPGQFTGSSPAWAKGSFGYQKPASKGGHIHAGVDIYAAEGTSIVAPVTGTVKSLGQGGTAGNYVKVVGDDGFEYYFAHMSSIHTGLARGMRVKQGTYLGGVGTTGNAGGTQAHLHFEIRKNGKSLNPTAFLETGQVQDTTSLSSIPGLSSVDQVQAFIDEYTRASAFMAGAEMPGFDPTQWGGGVDQATVEDEMQREQIKKGQNILGSTLNSMSTTLAGGNRIPMPRTTALTGGGMDVPSAEQQRQVVEETP